MNRPPQCIRHRASKIYTQLPFVDIEVHVQWFKIYFAFVDIPAHVQLMAEVHVASIHKLWQCTCGAWNLEEQEACPWKGNCKKKKQIPIAEYGDGVPVQHDESAVPLKEDNDEHIKKKIKVK